MSVDRLTGGTPDFESSGVDAAEHPAAAPAAPEATVSRAAASGTAAAARPVARTETRAPTSHLDRIAVGTLPGSEKAVYFDPVRGTFMAKTPGGRETGGSGALYAAAEVLASGDARFFENASLGAAGRVKLARTLEASIAQGNGATGTPRKADLQARSGAATLSLELAKTLPESDPVKGRLLAAYTGQMAIEPQRGLKASMVLNLEDAVKKGLVKLTPEQAKTLAEAKEATFPSKPPYDAWFKNGNTLNMRHYIHEEFFEGDSRDYEALGFKKTVLGPGHYLFEKEYTGADGKKMPVRVETFKTGEERSRDTVPMSSIFGDMNDPNVQIEMYGGHSNLGGNVLTGIAAGPAIQKGDKWAINWMCRGKQVLADVYNKYPDAHYSTTTTPVYAHGPKLLDTMFRGIANRESYGDMRKRFASDFQASSFMFPDDPRILEVRDIDRDGQVDIGAKGVDPLWNTGLLKGAEEKRDLEPVATARTPQDLQGDKVMRGVNFANTFITYHHEHENDGRIPPEVGDHITAGGFFVDRNSDDICRITERKVGNETFYDVAVNTKYADQESNALGAAILYELNRYLTKKQNNGAYTEDDKIRGAVFAGEFCAYMADSYEQVDEIMSSIQKRYGFPSKLTWDNVNRAIESDDHGYATPKQISALKRIIGHVDPRIG